MNVNDSLSKPSKLGSKNWLSMVPNWLALGPNQLGKQFWTWIVSFFEPSFGELWYLKFTIKFKVLLL